MTKQEYFSFAEDFYAQSLTISRKKNADYTGGDNNPFANFESVETLGIKTEHGFLTRMMDKFKRISSFVNQGTLQVNDESVTDTLRDLANYSCLLAGYIKSRQKSMFQSVMENIELLKPGEALQYFSKDNYGKAIQQERNDIAIEMVRQTGFDPNDSEPRTKYVNDVKPPLSPDGLAPITFIADMEQNTNLWKTGWFGSKRAVQMDNGEIYPYEPNGDIGAGPGVAIKQAKP